MQRGPTGPGGGSPISGWQSSGGTGTYTIDLELEPVPEPATLLLFGTALAGIGMARRRQRKQGWPAPRIRVPRERRETLGARGAWRTARRMLRDDPR